MTDSIHVRGPEHTSVVKAWNGQIDVRVRIAGKGPALVYFHPAAGLYWDQFLDRLAEHFTVYAPEMPGTSFGDPYAIHKVETYWDLLLIYEEVVRALGIGKPVAVGQSMGGMVTCDLAAQFTNMFSRIVALAPVGLWRDDIPVKLADLYAAPPEKVPEFLFFDPSLPQVKPMFALPDDPTKIPLHIATAVWTLGCSAKFLWPIPDTGLAKRLHRISVSSMIIWGREDNLVPSGYATEFGRHIRGSRVEIIDRCGHIPQMEQLEQTLKLVAPFLSCE